MKTNRSIRIAAVAFALTMLAAYVSFSQRQARAQATNVVAPSSKVQARLIQLPGGEQGQKTNHSLTNASIPLSTTTGARQEVISTERRKASVTNSASRSMWPGSKSVVPLLEFQTAPTLVRTNGTQPALSPKMVFPGSKSGRVFDPKDMQNLLSLSKGT